MAMSGSRVAVRAIVFAAGSVGGLSGAAYGLLNEQSKRARTIIGAHRGLPLNADGMYLPNGAGPFLATSRRALTFAVLGDSLAAGIGADTVDQLPGVRLAKGLAEGSGRPVHLSTHAISGSKTHDLPPQVDRALITPPDLALVIIGGNDVTSRARISTSAAMLAREVGRLMAAGAMVVVGTCPDLGSVLPIPQPLREIARRFGQSLARAQHRELDAIGATAVPMAELVSPTFLARPGEMFSADHFHPSGAGYEVAASALLAPLRAAAGLTGSTYDPVLPMAA
jgi:lysophospholipase L1-like esterase